MGVWLLPSLSIPFVPPCRSLALTDVCCSWCQKLLPVSPKYSMRRDQERKEQDNMERKEKELERIMIFKILQIT